MQMVDTALLGVVLASTVTCVAITAWLSAKSAPTRLISQVNHLISDYTEVRHEWEVAKLQLTQLIEGLEDVHERVKRAKAGNRSVQQRIEAAQADEGGDRIMQLRRKAGLAG
jgi:peptidoglycan hydrolase CwlO-like protein